MLDMATLLAAVVEYALLPGRWLIIVLDMVTLLAAVVEYGLLLGSVANNCIRYGYIVSRGCGVWAVVGFGG